MGWVGLGGTTGTGHINDQCKLFPLSLSSTHYCIIWMHYFCNKKIKRKTWNEKFHVAINITNTTLLHKNEKLWCHFIFFPEGQRCPSYFVRNCRFSCIANFSLIHLWNCCCAMFCPNIHYEGCKHSFVAHSRCLWFASFDKTILKQQGPYLWRPIAPHNATSSHSRCKKPQLTLYSMCRGVLYILEGSGLWGHSTFSTSAARLRLNSWLSLMTRQKRRLFAFFVPWRWKRI